jgi:hypothetical protein
VPPHMVKHNTLPPQWGCGEPPPLRTHPRRTEGHHVPPHKGCGDPPPPPPADPPWEAGEPPSTVKHLSTARGCGEPPPPLASPPWEAGGPPRMVGHNTSPPQGCGGATPMQTHPGRLDGPPATVRHSTFPPQGCGEPPRAEPPWEAGWATKHCTLEHSPTAWGCEDPHPHPPLLTHPGGLEGHDVF